MHSTAGISQQCSRSLLAQPNGHPELGRRILHPLKPTHIRILHKHHRKIPYLLHTSLLPSSEDHIVLMIGEEPVGEPDDVARIECIALVPPQLQMHGSGSIGHESYTHHGASFIEPRGLPLLENYKLRIHGAVRRRSQFKQLDYRWRRASLLLLLD
ncbi:hypothetical protein Mapa_011876 [Marchantia paleacea]|nr:hypothetical protein Mapa_011876 [Marchantia paleacea]